MIFAGLLAGVGLYYWLMPKVVAMLIVRRFEAIDRANHPSNRKE